MSEDRPDIPPPPAPEESTTEGQGQEPQGLPEATPQGGPAAAAPLPTIGGALSSGWEVLKKNPVVILAYLLVGILISTAAALPAVGFVVSLVVTGPLMTGLARYTLDLVDGKPGDFGDLFVYFQRAFGPTCLAGILLWVFHALGLLVICIGFFLVMATFGFTYLALADNRADEAWPALMFSKDLVAKDWLRMISFYLVIALVGVLGVLACVVGIVVTQPLAGLAIAAGYRVMVPLKDPLPSKLAVPEEEA